MAIKLCDQTCIDMVQSIMDRIDGGAGGGTIKILGDSQTTDPDLQATTAVLATITYSVTSYGTPAITTSPDRAEAQENSLTAESSATAGTAATFLIEDSVGTNVLTGTVTGTGGGGDLELNTVTIGAGATVTITDMPLSVTRD